MPKSINLSGTPGKNYDLEQISTKNTRQDSSEELLVQIWYWNPNGIESYRMDPEKYNNHKKPNPPSPSIGQIWLSRLVNEDFIEEV